MKKTCKANIKVSRTIEKLLDITFNNKEFPLDSWGHVDNWCQLSCNKLILLECEGGQKHPTTNILKVYSCMEAHPDIKVLFIHYSFPGNKTPKNRTSLCQFFGKKLEKYSQISSNMSTLNSSVN